MKKVIYKIIVLFFILVLSSLVYLSTAGIKTEKLNNRIIDKVKNIDKVYFDFVRNIDSGDMFLSNIFFNDKNSQNLLEELIKTNNMLVLKSTLRDILN